MYTLSNFYCKALEVKNTAFLPATQSQPSQHKPTKTKYIKREIKTGICTYFQCFYYKFLQIRNTDSQMQVNRWEEGTFEEERDIKKHIRGLIEQPTVSIRRTH